MATIRINPPAPPVTGAVFRCCVWTSFRETVAITTHDYMTNSFVGDIRPAMVTFGTAWDAAIRTPYAACLSENTSIVRVVFQCISNATVANIETTQITVGTLVGDTLPNEIAAIITRRGDLKGQHGRGRFSMPFVPRQFTGVVEDVNRLNSNGLDSYQSLCDLLQQPYSAGAGVSAKPVISTRPPKGAPLVVKADLTTTQFPTHYLGTIRRRKVGRGT